MIVNAVLFDLLGSKALSSLSFSKTDLSDDFLQRVVETYYQLMQEDSARDFVTIEIEEQSTCICKVSEFTIVVGVSDSLPLLESDIERMKRFQDASSKKIKQTSAREFKDEFMELESGREGSLLRPGLMLREGMLAEEGPPASMQVSFGDDEDVPMGVMEAGVTIGAEEPEDEFAELELPEEKKIPWKMIAIASAGFIALYMLLKK